MQTLTTHGIKISVESHYQALHSEPERSKYIHVYHIRIDNKNAFGVKLLRRHWVITEGDGKKVVVDGDGVIGKKPSIQAGGFHAYTSYCVLGTVIGKMKGHYELVREDTGEALIAVIPEFVLAFPPVLS